VRQKRAFLVLQIVYPSTLYLHSGYRLLELLVCGGGGGCSSLGSALLAIVPRGVILPLSLLAYAYFGVCASSPYCAAAGRPPPP
jgi:hypothetical protein